MRKQHVLSMAMAACLVIPSVSLATNGMNFEGYGAKATAMGGAAMAYDSGNSAVMNNPATLSLMPENKTRFGLGLRFLGPDIDTKFPLAGFHDGSDGTAYWMPSISAIRNSGQFSYGIAILAQGGMGTEYGDSSDLFSGGIASDGATAVPMSGEDIRSEVGVGRMMFPLSFKVNDTFSIGGSLDFVWAMMDLQMDIDGSHLGQLMTGNGGSVAMSPGLGGTMPANIGWARFDFSNSSDFSGEAKGYGLGGKIGFTAKLNDAVRIGGTYHTKTDIGGLKTSDASMWVAAAASPGAPMVMTGDIEVVDFQWPATWALGVAFQPSDRWLVVADVKRVEWSDVMESFKLHFEPDAMLGESMDVVMDQEWDDQTVYSVGLQYQATLKLALLVGANISDNPVPNTFLNPLFPAIVEEHYTAGFGYRFSKVDNFGLSLTYAPDVVETNVDGVEISHGQLNWSMSYVHLF